MYALAINPVRKCVGVWATVNGSCRPSPCHEVRYEAITQLTHSHARARIPMIATRFHLVITRIHHSHSPAAASCRARGPRRLQRVGIP